MTEIQKQAAAAKRDLNAEFRDYLDKWSGGGTDSAVAELKKHMESVRNGHRQQLREDHPQSRMNIEEELEAECKAIFHLLVRKNRAYGNSAAEPLNVLAQGTSLAQIAVRCDDKLKRIRNMKGLEQVLTCAALDGVRQMEARAEKAEAEYGHLNELYAHVEKHNAELSAALERVRDAMRCPDDFATCPTCLERIREAVDGPSAKPENGQ